MVRDEEIKRLVKYAEGLGLRVKFSYKLGADSASWTLDGTEIWINQNPYNSKTETILSLIHELGHHLWFIHQRDRQPDLKFEEAIVRHDSHMESNSITPKNLRQKILRVEREGTKWWEVVYKDTNIKIPLWKVHLAMEFDIWMYEEFAETGFFPKRKARRKKTAELLPKYRPKK